MSEIKLIASDGEEIYVEFDVINASTYLSKLLERDPDRSSFEIKEFPSYILKLVIEYIGLTLKKKPQPIPEVLNGINLKEDLNDDLFYDYINRVDLETAFQLINAGLVLELVHLHDLACSKIASFMKGKSVDDINKEFSIECQLTAEEAKTIGLEVDDQQC